MTYTITMNPKFKAICPFSLLEIVEHCVPNQRWGSFCVECERPSFGSPRVRGKFPTVPDLRGFNLPCLRTNILLINQQYSFALYKITPHIIYSHYNPLPATRNPSSFFNTSPTVRSNSAAIVFCFVDGSIANRSHRSPSTTAFTGT